MAVVGSAHVIVRAITERLGGDVRDGLQRQSSTFAAEGDKAGKTYTDSFEKGLGTRINESLEKNFKQTKAFDAFTTKTKSLTLDMLGLDKSFVSTFAKVSLVTGGIAALGGALTVLGAGAFALGAALTPALGTLVLLPAGLLGIAQAVGAASVAFKDLEAENPTPATLEFKAALEALQPALDGIRQNAAQSLFEKLTPAVSQLAGTFLPLLDTALSNTASQLGGVAQVAADATNTDIFKAQFARVAEQNAISTGNFGRGFVSLGTALVAVLDAARPLIQTFSTWFESFAAGINQSAQLGNATGSLAAFFVKAGEVIGTVVDIIKNFASALAGIGRIIAPFASTMLKGLETASLNLKAFVDSPLGQSQIAEFFDPNGPVMFNLREMGSLLKGLGKELVGLAQNQGIGVFAAALTSLLPTIGLIANELITGLAGAAVAIAAEFQSASGQAGVGALVDAIGALSTGIRNLAPLLGPVLQVVGAIGENLGKVLASFGSNFAPIFERVAEPLSNLIDQIGTLATTFISVLAPAIEPVIQAFIDFGSTVVPAIQSVIQALAPFFEAIGTGVATALAFFGDALSAVLGFLASLLGFLEPIAPVLGTLAGAVLIAIVAWKALGLALGVIGPLLTGISAVARGIGNTLVGPLTSAGSAARGAGTSFGGAATQTSKFSTAAGKVTGAMRGIGNNLPVIGLGLGLLAFAFEDIAQAQAESIAIGEGWHAMMRSGGEAAAQARKEMHLATAEVERFAEMSIPETAMSFLNPGEGGFTSFVDSANQLKGFEESLKGAREELGPLEVAQNAAASAQTAYLETLERFPPGSREATKALREYQSAQEKVDELNQQIADSQQTVTDKFNESFGKIVNITSAQLQAEQSSLGLQQAQLNIADAQDAYNLALEEFGPDSREAAQASLNLQGAQLTLADQFLATAEQAGNNAANLLTSGDAAEKTEVKNKTMLQSLKDMAATFGGEVPPAILTMIAELEKAVAAEAKVEETGRAAGEAVRKIPDQKHVDITVESEQAKADLAIVEERLGRLKDRTVTVSVFEEFLGGGGGGAGGGKPGRAIGGSVQANSFYRVGENGPELLSYQGRDYLMMGGENGFVQKLTGGTPATGGGGSLGAPVNINIYPPPGTSERAIGRIAADEVALLIKPGS